MEDKPIYTFAISRDGGKSFMIIDNGFGISTHESIDGALEDARMYISSSRFYKNSIYKPVAPIALDIFPLIKSGIIPGHRVFGSVRKILESEYQTH